jgi:hypothetical protein
MNREYDKTHLGLRRSVLAVFVALSLLSLCGSSFAAPEESLRIPTEATIESDADFTGIEVRMVEVQRRSEDLAKVPE